MKLFGVKLIGVKCCYICYIEIKKNIPGMHKNAVGEVFVLGGHVRAAVDCTNLRT